MTKPDNLLTIRDTVRWAMSEMERKNAALGQGTGDYWEEATFLVLRTLKLPFDRLESFWDARLTTKELEEVTANIARRVDERVPSPYILRESWLSGQSFYVDERVLIPRSFISELLAEDLAPWVGDPESVESVLDMCTGSGCLAILAAQAFPLAEVTAADISEDALAVARKNVAGYGLDGRMELVHSDLFSALEGRKFDVIISNPPYVTEESMAALPEEFRKEPELALVSGPDGMDAIARMMAVLGEHLTDEGIAVIELGGGREAFEARFPELPVTWLSTSGGDDMVFLVTAGDLRDAQA